MQLNKPGETVASIGAPPMAIVMAGEGPPSTPHRYAHGDRRMTVMAGEGPPSTPIPGTLSQAVHGGPAPAMTMKGRLLPSGGSYTSQRPPN